MENWHLFVKRTISKHFSLLLTAYCLECIISASHEHIVIVSSYKELLTFSVIFSRPVDVDKSETAPLFQETTRCTTSPVGGGIGTINRTLLHHQQNHTAPSAPLTSTSSQHKNGSAGYRGLVPMPTYDSESPPPEYNDLVHGKRHGFLFSFHNFYLT